MPETRPGLNVVRMEGFKKEPVPEFQSLAKLDRRIDEVGDAREGWVTRTGRVESMGSNETKKPGRLYLVGRG